MRSLSLGTVIGGFIAIAGCNGVSSDDAAQQANEGNRQGVEFVGVPDGCPAPLNPRQIDGYPVEGTESMEDRADACMVRVSDSSQDAQISRMIYTDGRLRINGAIYKNKNWDVSTRIEYDNNQTNKRSYVARLDRTQKQNGESSYKYRFFDYDYTVEGGKVIETVTQYDNSCPMADPGVTLKTSYIYRNTYTTDTKAPVLTYATLSNTRIQKTKVQGDQEFVAQLGQLFFQNYEQYRTVSFEATDLTWRNSPWAGETMLNQLVDSNVKIMAHWSDQNTRLVQGLYSSYQSVDQMQLSGPATPAAIYSVNRDRCLGLPGVNSPYDRLENAPGKCAGPQFTFEVIPSNTALLAKNNSGDTAGTTLTCEDVTTTQSSALNACWSIVDGPCLETYKAFNGATPGDSNFDPIATPTTGAGLPYNYIPTRF